MAAKWRGASEPSLVTAVRVDDAQGRFAGALAAVMPLSAFRPALNDPTLPAGTEVALADAQGELLLRTERSMIVPPPPGWAAHAADAGGAFYRARDSAGALAHAGRRPLLGRAVFVVLSAPAPTLLSWTRLNPIATLVLPLMAWLTAWAVGVGGRRPGDHPLARLP